jgi:hypothetical protein
MNGSTAMECLTIYNNVLLLAVRLTFGGAPCPSIWGILSETITDISNVLVSNKFWDHNTLFDPISNQLSKVINLPESTPFHQAKDMVVSLPTNDTGLVDIYIADNIGVAPEIDDNARRVNRAIALAINTVARPIHSDDPIPRKQIISQKKSLQKGKWMNVRQY